MTPALHYQRRGGETWQNKEQVPTVSVCIIYDIRRPIELRSTPTAQEEI
jgi:hypothetical protein